ncbi:hypothetical protein BDZ45DRAFT_602917, partial [Acephala macrosclerotiorum]
LPFLSALAGAEIGSGPGPYPDGSFYTSANQSPNATGSVFIEDLDMANTPIALHLVDWLASINISSIPNFPGSSNGSAITNSVLSLNVRGSCIENSTFWDTCAIVMEREALNTTAKGQNGNGNCSGTWGLSV